MTAPLCGNCGRETPTLAPCPCGLGRECRIIAAGVCARCYRMILANAIDRRIGVGMNTRHALHCDDDLCAGECQPEPDLAAAPYVDRYDPDDVEPMGGDPWWRERDL